MNQRTTKKAAPEPRAARLEVGSKAPDFALFNDEGERISLEKLEGKWVVLYFYPKDNTPGCSREAVAFRDAATAFKKAGAVVIGVSRDTAASHLKFRAKYDLTFPLLCDPTTEVHHAYGAFGEKTMYGKKIQGALRTTVLIRPDGIVARVFNNVKVDGHAESVLEALREEANALKKG